MENLENQEIFEKKFSIYNVDSYKDANKEFIETKCINVNIDVLKQELITENCYHFRIHKNTQYIFFGDLDNYEYDIKTFIKLLQKFLKLYYNLSFTVNEFKYTQNNIKKTSYHYSIPKWNISTENLKAILINFIKEYNDLRKIVDTTIYSEHWFRCPNQKKGMLDNTKHIIQKGIIDDFIVDYIPNTSKNINNIIIDKHAKNKIEKKVVIQDDDNIIIKHTKQKIENNDIIIKHPENTIIKYDNIQPENALVKNNTNLNVVMDQPYIYKKMFDDCYKQERFDMYEYWVSVGMAIKNTFIDETIAFDLFNYYSAKGNNYEGTEKTHIKFQTFVKKKLNNKFTVATIYYYAIEDNKSKFIEIMKKNTFELEQYDVCKYIKLLAGKRFIYVKTDNIYKLYCYNGKIWKNDDILLRQFISTELYDFLKTILIELYFEHTLFSRMKTQITKLKTANFKSDLVKMYKEVNTNDQLKFDDKWFLLGFNNIVYDLQYECFRDYKYDDFMVTTTGYDWMEPTKGEIETINKLLYQIMPNDDERELYLQIMSSCLDGKTIEKCIIYNGSGGNGKGMINDLLLIALGEYGFIGNNSILFEHCKMGSNPEKANMHKKRLVLFREPPETKKFENSIIKELTGGGTFSARGHHETTTKKELNLTMIIECNKKPLFVEEPTDAETRRIIDLAFKSKFTEDLDIIDETKHIYQANSHYKTNEFQQKHKYALLTILFNAHKRYKNNNYILSIPLSIKERTRTYLELSCNIIQWFKDNYELTNNNLDICKMIDLYHDFTHSIYFVNLMKHEKRKYNKAYFTNYIKTNIFFKEYHKERYNNIRNCLICWKPVDVLDAL